MRWNLRDERLHYFCGALDGLTLGAELQAAKPQARRNSDTQRAEPKSSYFHRQLSADAVRGTQSVAGASRASQRGKTPSTLGR
jgi:hypothetical protein